MNDIYNNMVYAARYPNRPGYGAVCIDDPKSPKETARFVSDMIKMGATIERVTHAQSVVGLREYEADLDRRRNTPSTSMTTLPLFGGESDNS